MEFSGEMIVRPLQPATLEQAGKGEFEQFVIRTRARDRIVRFAKEYVPQTDEYVIKVPPGYTENKLSRELMQSGDYQYVAPNWICYPAVNPNDAQFSGQWHHVKVQSPQAWDIVTGNSAITVAVVDTGIDLTHPDLAPNRVPGYNSVDRLPEVSGGQVNDLNGHGTHVAGDAAAIGNNSIGVAGMGWNFKIMMIRTSNSAGGGASVADMMAGARWAAENGAKTASVSYSGVDSPSIGTTGTYLKSIGSLLLFAAGNDNRNLSGFFHEDAIVVGASNQTDAKAGFSAYGRAIHVFAPGVGILSTTNGGGYGPSDGTSMATPVANGAVAMIWAANPSLTAQEVHDILRDNCDVIGSSDIFGSGRINQFKNVIAAQASTPLVAPPVSIAVVEGTHAGGSVTDILVPNTGGPSFNVNSVNQGRMGHVSSVVVTYDTGVSSSSIRALTVVLQSKVTPMSLTTGNAYLKNWSTGKFEAIGQFSLRSTGWVDFSTEIRTNPGRFVGPGGNIEATFRTVGARAGGRLGVAPYTFKIGHSQIGYTVFN